MKFIDPRSKVLWHADRLLQLQYGGITHAPVNVEIDLSNRCSHGCSWCHFAHTHTRGPLAGSAKPTGMLDCGDMMDTRQLKGILEQLGWAGVRSITWSGGGEPTLHPDFSTIVRQTAKMGFEQGLYTNGGHINEAKAQLLKQHMTFVYVSLDECEREAFKASKGVDRFMQVCDGISRLVDAEGDAVIGIGFLLHQENFTQVPNMVELGRKLGADYVQFRPIVHYDQDNPTLLAEDTSWIDHAVAYLETWQEDPFVSVDIERFRMYQNWQGHGYSTCNWSAMQTVITPNGKVWRCVNRRGHEGALLGDLAQDTFKDIWQGQGGPCAVAGDCRVMCRGHIANITLDAVLAKPAHANFI